jgi:methionyl-tRNA formyltransferase
MGLDVVCAGDVNAGEFVADLTALTPRLSMILGYPKIFRKSLIESPELGTINLHAGPLPQYRGGSPLNWQILNGEEMAGISIIQIDEGIDTGPVLAEAKFPIGPDDAISDAHDNVNKRFPELLLDVLSQIEAGKLSPRPQQKTGA